MSACVLFVVFGVCALAIGLVVLRAGWRGAPQTGTVPHCPHCEYNLTGLTESRCPECGQPFELQKVLFLGPRQRNWSGVSAGVVILALSAWWLWGSVWRASHSLREGYIHLRPTAWLIGEISSSNARLRYRAVEELLRRHETGDLSASQVTSMKSPLLKTHVASHARGMQWESLVVLLGEMWARGELSDSEKDRFFRHLQPVRYEYLPGQRLIHAKGCTLWGTVGAVRGLVSRQSIGLISVEGTSVERDLMTFYSHHNLSFGWKSEDLPARGVDRLGEVGDHFKIRVRTAWFDFGDDPAWEPFPDRREIQRLIDQHQPKVAHAYFEDWQFARDDGWKPTLIATGADPTTMPAE